MRPQNIAASMAAVAAMGLAPAVPSQRVQPVHPTNAFMDNRRGRPARGWSKPDREELPRHLRRIRNRMRAA